MQVMFVVVLAALAVQAVVAGPTILNGDLCPECQNEVIRIENGLSNNATDQQIIDELDKLCALLPTQDQAECKNVVATIGLSLNTSDLSLIYKYSPNALCAMIGFCQFDCCATPVTPEQVHLSTGSDITKMTVTWTTLEQSPNPVVEYGLAQGVFTMTANATSHTFTKGGWRGQIHVATMTGLQPGTQYYYRVGDPTFTYWSNPEWSQPLDFNFVTRAANLTSSKFTVFGDMGATDISSETILRLNTMVEAGELDFIMHIGDIAYADGWETLFDEFLRKVETISAYVPYMVTPGNHEIFYDFTPYKNRYVMPYEQSGSPDPMYYSFDYGNVHIVALNTESPVDVPSDLLPNSTQYKWLEADLIKANENRKNVPWILVVGHRPLYCVPVSGKDCKDFASYLRTCIEDLLYHQGVDIVVGAHMHNYEVTYPTYQSKAYPGFVNPVAPVYIVSGAAGNKEHLTGIGQPPYPEWSRLNLEVYGFGVVDAPNATHLTWSFLSSESGDVLDTFTLVKNA